MMTHTLGGVVFPRIAVARLAAPDARLDEAMALRRCAMYRKAFRGTTVSFPADVLRFDAVADWVRRRGATIDAASAGDVDDLRLSRIDASHVVMRCGAGLSVAMCRAGFSRFIVDSGDQIAMLADNSLAKTQHVVVEATRPEELAAEVLPHKRLNLIGLHAPVGIASGHEVAATVTAMIGKMAGITGRHSVVLSCVSLGDVAVPGADGDPRALRRLAGVIDQAVEDGCIRHRYPRPAVTVSPKA